MNQPCAPCPGISIVIPVYNEQERITPLLRHLDALPFSRKKEIVVVDGAPGQTTLAAMRDSGITLQALLIELSSAPGRALQMNLGAHKAGGDILLFLHADTSLPDDGLSWAARALQDPAIVGGAFSLRIASPSPLVRLIGRGTTLRSRLTRVPFGDQALFFRRKIFFEAGGFPQIPIMEDLEFMRGLRANGKRIAILPQRVTTSGRRWEKEGALRCTLRNMLLRLRYRLGTPPELLARHYRRHGE